VDRIAPVIAAHGRPSAWSPLRHRTFAVLWTATLISNIGTWMHDLAAGWLMTTLAPSPAMVAMVQAAMMLPIFLFSLPAGALADMVDRRRMLIVVQMLMLVLAAVLSLLVFLGSITPGLLLALTFGLGVCTAAMSPAWQAIVPRLVDKEDFPAAVALSSVSINISRAIGPAIGGVLIASLGLAWPFLFNAVSFIAVIAALVWWRPAVPVTTQPAREAFVNAMVTGVRHVWDSAPLKATLLRVVAFFAFASAYWALLPLIARQRLDGGSQLYGVLVACIGVGAVSGAQFLPRLRARFGPDRVIIASTCGTALVLITFALVEIQSVAALACLVAGATWIAAISTFSVSMQLLLPDWVRARGLAVYNTIFYGSLTLGSVLWGQFGEHFGIEAALLAAAAGILLGMTLARRIRLQR
jgi:MFS family permease